MDIPEIVEYPKYLLNTEFLNWLSVHKGFRKLRNTENSVEVAQQLLDGFPCYAETTFPNFYKYKMNLTFWEQRVLLGVLALFTEKSFASPVLHTSLYRLCRSCFISEKYKNGRLIFSRRERDYVRENLFSIAEKKDIFFTRSYTDVKGIFHFNPSNRSILSVDGTKMGLFISLNIEPEDFEREMPYNYYLVPSNVFTHLKSGSRYSPLFVKWLIRQDSKRSKIVIERKNLIKILSMGKSFGGTNKKWAEKTLLTAYQEAKNAGVIRSFCEKDGRDVFYRVNRKVDVEEDY